MSIVFQASVAFLLMAIGVQLSEIRKVLEKIAEQKTKDGGK